MALQEDRSDDLSLEMARVREELAELRRDMKILMWECSIGFAGTFAGLGIIAVLAS